MERKRRIKNRRLEQIIKYMNVKIFLLLISKIQKLFSKSKIREVRQHWEKRGFKIDRQIDSSAMADLQGFKIKSKVKLKLQKNKCTTKIYKNKFVQNQRQQEKISLKFQVLGKLN